MSYSSSCIAFKASEKDNPLDTVSLIVWDTYRGSDLGFLCSSWDGYLRYYELSRSDNLTRAWQFFLEHPVLCCDISPNNVVFAGLASGDVMAVSMMNNQVIHLGSHQAPICGIFWINQFSCLMTLGFDNLIKFWTLQAQNNNFMQLEIKLPSKTHTACFDFPYLAIGSRESLIAVIDIKNMPNIDIPRQYIKANIENYSKFNCSKINAEYKRIIMGTADGRTVNIQFKDSSTGMKFDPFVTRTQKRGTSVNGLYGQVNSVDFGISNHEVFGLIAGTQDFAMYNLIKKTKGKNMSNTSNFYGAVTAIRMNPTYEYVAYASGTDWLKGITELQNIRKPKVMVSKLTKSQLSDLVSRY